MVLIVVGLGIIGLTVGMFLVARQDWSEDVSDISPFPEEVEMVKFIQSVSKIVTLVLSVLTITLGLWLIVRGIAAIM